MISETQEPNEAAIQRTALVALGWYLKKNPNGNIRLKAYEIARAVLEAQHNGWDSFPGTVER